MPSPSRAHRDGVARAVPVREHRRQSRGCALFGHHGSTACHGECGSPDARAADARSRRERLRLGQRGREQHVGADGRRRGKQRGVMAGDEPGVDCAGRERLMRDDTLQEGDVGRDADDLVLGERLGEPAQRRGPILAVDDRAWRSSDRSTA